MVWVYYNTYNETGNLNGKGLKMEVFFGGGSPVIRAIKHARATGEKCVAFYPTDLSGVFLSQSTAWEDAAFLVGPEGVEKEFSITRVGP